MPGNRGAGSIRRSKTARVTGKRQFLSSSPYFEVAPPPHFEYRFHLFISTSEMGALGNRQNTQLCKRQVMLWKYF